MKGQLEGLWRDVEAFAREGTAAHEVESNGICSGKSLAWGLLC